MCCFPFRMKNGLLFSSSAFPSVFLLLPHFTSIARSGFEFSISLGMTKFSAGIALLFFFVFCCENVFAENEERIYRDYIKTVMLHNSASQLSNPLIALQSNEKIILKFDDLSGEINSYDYKVVACNSDWTNTTMFPAEYVEGFQESAIIDYYMSSAVNSRYVHFRLELPNFDMSFKK